MKKLKINLIVLLLGILSPAIAVQNSIEQVYIDMPDFLDPSMTSKQRQELIEYYKADLGDSITNRFEKYTYLKQFNNTNGFIEVKTTEISTMQLKLLQLGNDTLVGVIKTVCIPICQSTIEFYDTNWQKRSDIIFNMPKALDWLDKDKVNASGLNIQNVNNILRVNFISLAFSLEGNEITAINDSPKYLDKNDYEIISPLLHNSPLTYKIENNYWIKRP